MAEYLLRNSLNSNKVVKCGITFRKLTNKGEEGEPVWLVQVSTAEPHKDGGDIAPAFIHLTTLDNLDVEVTKATETIALQTDWTPLQVDSRAPIVSFIEPVGDLSDVPIYSSLRFEISELFPAAGIDIDSIEVTVNGVDVTSELDIIGDPYLYKCVWNPFKRVLDYY